MYIAPGADHIGELQAWNLDTGQKVWNHPFANSPLWGPVLATAGGVLFAGGTNDRYFRAFDASNGKILWELRTGSGVNGVPVSFQIDGKQYVAVQSGWGATRLACRRASTWCRRGSSPMCRRAARSGCSPSINSRKRRRAAGPIRLPVAVHARRPAQSPRRRAWASNRHQKARAATTGHRYAISTHGSPSGRSSCAYPTIPRSPPS
jgi:PQQ enzyme repeat